MPRMSDPVKMALFLAQSVVDQPAAVRATVRGPTIMLRVAGGEEGRVIGRQGRVISAIRTLVRAADAQGKLGVDLDAPRRER